MIAKNNVQLHSTGIYKVLNQTLWILFILCGISAFISLVNIVLPSNIFSAFALFDASIASFIVIIDLVTIVMALIWLFRLHKDLNAIYQEYPIAPGSALLQFMVPFYNIWGIGNTLGTIASYLKSEATTEMFGNTLKSLIPWLYAMSILSSLLNRVLLTVNLTEYPVIYLITGIVDLSLIWVRLQILQTTYQAIRTKALNI